MALIDVSYLDGSSGFTLDSQLMPLLTLHTPGIRWMNKSQYGQAFVAELEACRRTIWKLLR